MGKLLSVFNFIFLQQTMESIFTKNFMNNSSNIYINTDGMLMLINSVFFIPEKEKSAA